MSNYFDVVITCDLREDTPEEVINIIRYLTDKNYELSEIPNIVVEHDIGTWEGIFDRHFLAPDPERETISNFQKMWRTSIPAENNRKVYRYMLQYSGRNIHDDFWAEYHVPFVYWLARHVYEDVMGYMKYTRDGKPGFIFIEDGKPAGEWWKA